MNASSFRQEIIRGNSCSSDSSDCPLITGFSTLPKRPTIHSLILYPNPAQHYTLVDNPTGEEVRLAIYTINGQQLLEQVSISFQILLSLTNLDVGMYFVCAYFERQEVWAMGKLIKI